VALFIEEGHGGDGVNSFVASASFDSIDGTEDTHLQIDRRLLHEALLVGGSQRLKHKPA
jgi:hypothetical protein